MYHALPCDTAGEHALATIKNWIRECVIEHEECDDGSLRLLPKRILEIEGDKLLLREDRTEPAHYACLSHCWGANGPQQRLTHGSYEIHKEGLIIEILPPTFYDAVQLCKRLHLRYIWIDALCIVQDDFEDWNETAGLMAEIYSNAYITIGASGAMDCTRGLYTKLPMRPKELGNAPGLFVMPLSRPHDDFGTLPLPLLTRAWVFQEHVVSPRFLHFGPGFLLWKCRNTQCTETGDVSSQGWAPFFYNLLNNQFPEIASQALKILDKVHSWHRIIEGYSNLKLTYDTDRLAAISAVVYRHMKNRAGDRYIAGMWENSLLPDL
ncbi:HET-domain-containing protein, partial [Polyplosphaeria fusca]